MQELGAPKSRERASKIRTATEPAAQNEPRKLVKAALLNRSYTRKESQAGAGPRLPIRHEHDHGLRPDEPVLAHLYRRPRGGPRSWRGHLLGRSKIGAPGRMPDAADRLVAPITRAGTRDKPFADAPPWPANPDRRPSEVGGRLPADRIREQSGRAQGYAAGIALLLPRLIERDHTPSRGERDLRQDPGHVPRIAAEVPLSGSDGPGLALTPLIPTPDVT